jgi:hypothetical protein
MRCRRKAYSAQCNTLGKNNKKNISPEGEWHIILPICEITFYVSPLQGSSNLGGSCPQGFALGYECFGLSGLNIIVSERRNNQRFVGCLRC